MKAEIIYWWKIQQVKREYKRIRKELKRVRKELEEVAVGISLLSGGSGDPLPAGSGLGILKKDNHAINNS
jgi:hypothetical protein